MAINQLGEINFPDLDNYDWTADNFGLFQTYIQNALKEIITSGRSVGILYGGVITPGSGLSVNVSKALALFSDGTLVTIDTSNVPIAAADPSNPRIDRIELSYSQTDGTSVENVTADSEVLDKLYTGTYADNAGAAAGSPTAPNLTAGRISIGLVTVPAAASSIITGDISQLEDTAFNPSAVIMGDSSHLLRLNRTSGLFEFSYDGGTTWGGLPAWQTAKIITVANSPYTVTREQPNLEVNTSGGNVVVLLPPLGAGAFPVRVAKSTSDSNQVQVTPAGTDPIMDSNSVDALTEQFANKFYDPLSTAWVY